MRAVKQAQSAPFTSSGYFVALMLVLFSASGLLAGVLTRQVASTLRAPSGPSPSALAPADMTATANAATLATARGFTLHVIATPTAAKAGQTVQVAVTALALDATTPMAGVRCSLVQTTDSLALTPWPDPVTTDVTGRAQWSISVPPSTAPGSYSLSVRGDGPTGYRFTWRQTLNITA